MSVSSWIRFGLASFCALGRGVAAAEALADRSGSVVGEADPAAGKFLEAGLPRSFGAPLPAELP